MESGNYITLKKKMFCYLQLHGTHRNRNKSSVPGHLMLFGTKVQIGPMALSLREHCNHCSYQVHCQ